MVLLWLVSTTNLRDQRRNWPITVQTEPFGMKLLLIFPNEKMQNFAKTSHLSKGHAPLLQIQMWKSSQIELSLDDLCVVLRDWAKLEAWTPKAFEWMVQCSSIFDSTQIQCTKAYSMKIAPFAVVLKMGQKWSSKFCNCKYALQKAIAQML